MTVIPEGFSTDPGFDAAEDHTGPFYYKPLTDGRYECVFLAEAKNCNVNGLVHGGVLMTFADFALCMAATDHYAAESCATITFSADFVSAVSEGELVSCTPEVTRKTGSMVFVTGAVKSAGEVAMTFSAVVKRLRNS